MYVYVPYVYLVPAEARRWHQISWNWNYRLLWPPCRFWELNRGRLQEQPVRLAIESSFQFSLVTLMVIKGREWFSKSLTEEMNMMSDSPWRLLGV